MAVGFLEGEIDEVNDGRDFMKLSCAEGVVAHARYRSMTMFVALVVLGVPRRFHFRRPNIKTKRSRTFLVPSASY